MNERIKELKLQAIKLVAESYPCDIEDFTDGIDERVRAKVDEKFAELIVEECAETIRGSMIKHCTGVVLNTDYNLGLSKASTSIKEHFGVEE